MKLLLLTVEEFPQCKYEVDAVVETFHLFNALVEVDVELSTVILPHHRPVLGWEITEFRIVVDGSVCVSVSKVQFNDLITRRLWR